MTAGGGGRGVGSDFFCQKNKGGRGAFIRDLRVLSCHLFGKI